MEIEDELFALFDQRQIACAHESGCPADGVVENRRPKFSFRQILDLLSCAGSCRVDHFSQQADQIVLSALFYKFEQTHTHAVCGRAAGPQIRNEHGWSAQAVDRVELQEIVANLEIFRDLDGWHVQALFESRLRADRHPAGFNGAGFGGVQRSRGPGQQLAFGKNGHQGDLVRIVNTTVKRIVGVKNIAIADARVFRIVFKNEFDDDGLNDGVEIGATSRVDKVAVGREDGHHRIAGNPKIAARRPNKDFHRLIEDVVGDLYADFIVALLQ